MRNEIIRSLKARPFHPFVIITDSGDRVAVNHPENVAYDPELETRCLYAISHGILYTVPWEKISSLARLDSGEPLGSNGEHQQQGS